VVSALGEQISTLVQGSRREELELMLDPKKDPYGRISDALDAAGADATLSSDARFSRGGALVQALVQTRSSRLSSEALSLPEVHFQILLILGVLLISSYPLTGAEQLREDGGLPVESCLLFGVLSGIFNLMYSFVLDLNQPFEGVYQVRRSAAATNLLGARLMLDEELGGRGLDIERVAPAEFSANGAGTADPRPC